MSEKVKKPFYKKWWFWLIVFFVAVGALVSGGEGQEVTTQPITETEVNDTQQEQTEQPKEETKEAKPVVKTEEPKKEEPKEESIKSGTYKIGTDIPAGEYLVFSNGMAYIEGSKDSTGTLESIIFNDNLMNNAHAYVTLNDGIYFKLQDAIMYPVDKAPSIVPENGLYMDGMYKVGKDIPAGEYKVILEDNIMGMGYYEVSKSSSHQLGDIITNENVQADTYLTVSEGQYLKLQDVSIQK